MKNYICINGNKTELSDAQVKELGFCTGQYTAAELSEIVRSGKAREYFNIRNTVEIGGREFEIIGFDHDNPDDSDIPHTITLMTKDLLPARRMHSGACERGWIDTDLRAWLNNDYIDQLPDELTAHICSVSKITHNYGGEAFTTIDRLFVPSESELFGSAIWSDYEDGQRYEAFSNRHNRIRLDEDGDGDWYWTRSARGGTSTNCAIVGGYGLADFTAATNTSIRVPVCFCFA